MKKVILLPEDRQRFETALGQALPNPSSPEFEEFLDVLQEEKPELATEIRNSVKVLGIPSANDVQAVKAKETKKNAVFWQNLFYKQTPDGWVQDKGKITRTAIIAGGALVCVLALGLFVRPAQGSGFSLGGLNNKVPVNSSTSDTTTTLDPNAPVVVPAPDGTNPDGTNPDPNNPNGTNPDPTNPKTKKGTNPNNPSLDPNTPKPEPFEAAPTPRQTSPVNNNGSSGTASAGYPNQSGSSQNSSAYPSNSGSSGANTSSSRPSAAPSSNSAASKSSPNKLMTASSGKVTKHNFVLQNSNANPSNQGARMGSAMVLASNPTTARATPNQAPVSTLSVQNTPATPQATPNQAPFSALSIQNSAPIAPTAPRQPPLSALSVQNAPTTPRTTATPVLSSALSVQNAPTTPRVANTQTSNPSSALSVQNASAAPRPVIAQAQKPLSGLSIQNSSITPRPVTPQTQAPSSALSVQNAPTTPRVSPNQAPSSALSVQSSAATPRTAPNQAPSSNLSIQNAPTTPRTAPNQTPSSALSVQNAPTTPRPATTQTPKPPSSLNIQNAPATPRPATSQTNTNSTSGIALQSNTSNTRPQTTASQTSSGLSVQNAAASARATPNQTSSSNLGIASSERPAAPAPRNNTMLISSNTQNNTNIPITNTGGIALGGGNSRPSQNSASTPSSLPLGFPTSAPQDAPLSTNTTQQSQASGLPGSGDLPRLESVMPLAVGSRLSAKLVISVVAVEQGSAPIVAVSENPPCGKETCPSIVWIGQALLGPDRRVWASFTQATVDGKLYSVAGQALEPTELRPGLPAQISDEAPSLISDLLRGAIGSFSDFLGAQLGARNTSTSGGVTTQTQTVPSLQNFFLGRLSGLFSIPSDTKALVRVARVPVDTNFTMLYGIPLNIAR